MPDQVREAKTRRACQYYLPNGPYAGRQLCFAVSIKYSPIPYTIYWMLLLIFLQDETYGYV